MQTALISGVVSLVIAGIGLLVTAAQLRSQRERFRAEISERRTDRLLEIRLKNYPSFFQITGRLFQKDIDPGERRELHAKVRSELQLWRAGEVTLVASKALLDTIFELEDSLSKGPAERDSYSQDQLHKLFALRLRALDRLRRDVGLMHSELEERALGGIWRRQRGIREAED